MALNSLLYVINLFASPVQPETDSRLFSQSSVYPIKYDNDIKKLAMKTGEVFRRVYA